MKIIKILAMALLVNGAICSAAELALTQHHEDTTPSSCATWFRFYPDKANWILFMDYCQQKKLSEITSSDGSRPLTTEEKELLSLTSNASGFVRKLTQDETNNFKNNISGNAIWKLPGSNLPDNYYVIPFPIGRDTLTQRLEKSYVSITLIDRTYDQTQFLITGQISDIITFPNIDILTPNTWVRITSESPGSMLWGFWCGLSDLRLRDTEFPCVSDELSMVYGRSAHSILRVSISDNNNL